jgi:TolA-binding protein
MTTQQKDNILDVVKAWALPLSMGIASFFLSEIYSDMKSMRDQLQEMQISNERRNQQILHMQELMSEMHEEVEELKKNLDIEY